MRKDMADVIVNCARQGEREPKGLPHYSLDGKHRFVAAPAHEPMRPRIHSKEQSDRLKPVIRFLRSRIGQQWDDVWSEICEVNKYGRGDVRKQHLRKHVWKDLVETTPDPKYPAAAGLRDGFYVDDDGVLREHRSKRYRSSGYKVKRPRNFVFHEGAWKVAKLEKIKYRWDENGNKDTPSRTLRNVERVTYKRDRMAPAYRMLTIKSIEACPDIFGFDAWHRKHYYGNADLAAVSFRAPTAHEREKYNLVDDKKQRRA